MHLLEEKSETPEVWKLSNRNRNQLELERKHTHEPVREKRNEALKASPRRIQVIST